MRNLKRALSLVMAAAMLIGMMVVSASAADNYEDFTDKDEIKNTEAVATMVSLGVINGKEDGSYFDPTGIVTRAEMAKLIAVSLNGGKDPVLGSGASTTQFSDTKGNWAEAYIAYCANLGIINGRGDGTFGPNEPVTGTAAAKMMLTALGYRSDIEKLTGTGWDLNTDTLANKVGLYDGLDITPSNGLSRDDTAQLIYNGVQAQEVEYRNNYGEYSGVIYAQDKGTMLENRFGVVKVEGIVAANEIFGLDDYSATQAGKTRLVSTNTYGDKDGENYDGVYPVSMDNDLVGQRVVIYVKFQNSLSPNATSSTVVGNPIISNKSVVVETSAKLKDADAVKDALKDAGIAIGSKKAQDEYVINETGISATKDADKTNGVTKFDAEGDGKLVAMAGVTQRFIDNNGDGTVDIIFQETAAISKVSSYNTKDEKLTLSGIGSIDFDEIANYDDVAKDDYVLVTKYEDTYYLAVAETVEGEVTAYNSSNAKITVDGESYAIGAGFLRNKITADLDVDLTPDALSDLVGNSYTLYLDAAGNVVAASVLEEAIGSYAVVTASGSEQDMLNSWSGQVKLIMSDGTTGTYDVDLLASAKKFIAGAAESGNSAKEAWMANELKNNGMKNAIVTYSINDDGDVVLGEPDKVSKYDTFNGDSDDVDEFVSSTSTYTVGGQRLVADNSTVFFFLDASGDYSVTVGLNKIPSRGVDVKTTGGKGDVAIVGYGTGSSRSAKAVFAEIEAESYASSSNYALVTDKFTKTTENGDTVYTYPVVFEDGQTGTLKTKLTDSISKNTVYAYTLDSKGYVTEFDSADDYVINNVYVADRGNNTVTLNSMSNYDTFIDSKPLASGATVWNVEDTDDIFDTNLSKYDVVAVVLNDDYAIKTAFIVDTINEDDVADMTALEDLKVQFGGTDITKAIVGETITATFTKGGDQTVKYAVNGEDKGELSSGAAVYTVDGTESGKAVKVVITVEETDKTSRVYTYDFTVTAAGKAAAPTSVVLDAHGTNGATVTGGPVTLNQGDNTVAVTSFADGSADCIKFDVTGAADTTVAVKLDTNSAGAQDYTSGDSVDLGSTTGTVNYVLTVTVTADGLNTATYTYNVAVTVA